MNTLQEVKAEHLIDFLRIFETLSAFVCGYRLTPGPNMAYQRY